MTNELIAILERFKKHQIKLNINKMKFPVREAIFTGHLITTDGIRTNPAIVKAILNMPTPSDKVGIRRFLGAMNYLSKFSPQLSSVTHSLRTLTKDDVPFLRSTQHRLDEAQTLVTTAPCLAYYNVSFPASDYGLGAALLQPTKLLPNNTFDESCLYNQ